MAAWRLLRSNRPGLQLVRSSLQLVALVLYIIALSHVPLTAVTMAFFTAPLMVVALSVPMLGERVGPRRWAAVAVGFAGAAVIFRPGGEIIHWSFLLVLGAAAAYALFQIQTRQLAAHDDYRTTAIWTRSSSPWWRPRSQAPSSGRGQRQASPTGAPSSALGVFGGLRPLPASSRPTSTAAPRWWARSTTASCIGAAVVGFLWFGEVVDLWTWLGAAHHRGERASTSRAARRSHGADPPPPKAAPPLR